MTRDIGGRGAKTTKLYQGSLQSIAGDETYYRLDLGVEEFDQLEGASASLDTITIPVTGPYLVLARVGIQFVPDQTEIELMCRRTSDDKEVATGDAQASNASDDYLACACATPATLEAGDTLHLEARQDSGVSLDVDKGDLSTYLSLMLL